MKRSGSLEQLVVEKREAEDTPPVPEQFQKTFASLLIVNMVYS